MAYEIRKWHGMVEEIIHEGGKPGGTTLLKAIAAVVIRNPFGGNYSPDLSALIEPSHELGRALGRRALAMLNGRAAESYGKGAMAGVDGEQEHAVACLTTVFGDALREAIGGGKAWISSSTKVGSAGEALDIPLAYKDALFVRSHYDAVTLRIPDAPRPGELVVAVAVATGPRIHQRVGGLTRENATKGDGLR